MKVVVPSTKAAKRSGQAWKMAGLPAGLVLVCAAMSLATPQIATAFELVSKTDYVEDMNRYSQADHKPLKKRVTRSVGVGPTITVVKPSSVGTLKSPVDIVVDFIPLDNSPIDFSTLHVTYGWFGLDVTERLLQNAKRDKNRISATGAQLPEGSHKFHVSITDAQGRSTESDIAVVVKDP